MQCYTYLRNVTDFLSDGKTPYERRFGQPFEGAIIPLETIKNARKKTEYIDVSRTTHTNLDVEQEKRIDDYWNIDGSRGLV